MPQAFETLNPQPSTISTTGDELQSLASKARSRQQEILKNAPLSKASQFPAQSAPGTLPNLLGQGETLAQPQGLEGITNVNVGGQERRSPANQPQGPSVDQVIGGAPTSAPLELEPEPIETAYTDLTPTQRNTAMKYRGIKVNDFATDEAGEARRTDTGAMVLSIENDGGDKMFLAEDGIAAHSAAMQIARRLGIGAVPKDSTRGGDLGYTVAWSVPREREQQFLSAIGQLRPTNVVLENDEYHITFDAGHGLNRTFMSAPFGKKDPLSDAGRQ